VIPFILRRLLVIPLILLVVNLTGFTYAHYARPLRAERTPYVSQAEMSPVLPAYRGYLMNLFQLSLADQLALPGRENRDSMTTMGEAILRATAASLGLLTISLGLSILVGFYLGFIAVKTEPRGIKRWLTSVTTIGLAMPSFYIGSLLIFASVYYVLRHGPGTQTPLPIDGFGWDLHLVLPIMALMARPTMQLAQVTAGQMSSELGKQYVVAARSLGYTWRSIRSQYALRNVIAPLILTVAGLLRFTFGELILVEWLFRWPGLGRLLAWTLVPAQLTSSSGSPLFLNPPLMATILVIIAFIFLISDFVAALLVKVFDPRLRNPESEVNLA
jgi:peptide/nickel transport system permease protein